MKNIEPVFKPGTSEFYAHESFLKGLEKFKRNLLLRRNVISVCLPALESLTDSAKANEGKKLGAVMKEKLLDSFQAKVDSEMASLDNSKFRVSLYWDRPYDFMKSPEFSIKFWSDRYLSLGSWAPKLNGKPYENTINAAFLDCIEEMKGALKRYLKEIDTYLVNEKRETRKLIRTHISLIKSQQAMSDQLSFFRAGGTLLGTVESVGSLFKSYR